ncbi:MAG: PDZ domain-containing protein [Planctomycetota bacterium]|jgi:hypothetical protein|nr:PDZ domain-containing protein [Planctomycetota bacterium]
MVTMVRFLFSAVLITALLGGGSALAQKGLTQERGKLTDKQRAYAEELIAQLGSPDFKERREAAKKLEGLGKKVGGLLERALKDSKDPELRWQTGRLLRRLKGDSPALRPDKSQAKRSKRGARQPPQDRKDDDGRLRLRFPKGEFDGTRVRDIDAQIEKLQQQLHEVFKKLRMPGLELDGLRGNLPGWPQGLPRGKSPSGLGPDLLTGQSTKIEMGPDGVRIEIGDNKDGKSSKRVYEAENMDSLLKKHPELKGRVSGWSSNRRDGGPFRLFRKGFGFEWNMPRTLRGPSFPKAGAPGGGRRVKELDKGKIKDVEEGSVENEPVPEGPKLGVYLRDGLSIQLRGFLDLPEGVGLWIDRVVSDSTAARAGIKAGDIITKINGSWMRGAEDVRKALSKGKKVRVDYIRKGARRSSSINRK